MRGETKAEAAHYRVSSGRLLYELVDNVRSRHDLREALVFYFSELSLSGLGKQQS